jgi:hypothetical protein
MSPQLACLLCGADDGEVTVRLVEWREPIAGRRYDTLPRCVNVEACWTRVTSVIGEDWPVNDDRPAKAPAIEPEPLPEPPPPPADASMEEPAWLAN